MVVTPGTLDTYSRYMVSLFDEKQIIGVSTVWQQFFGKPAFGGSKTIYSPDNEVVDIDIMRGNERMAAMVQRGTNSRNLNQKKNTVTQQFSSFSRVYPLAEEIGDVTASQLLKRVAGENPYEIKTRQQRLRILALEHHLEHIRRYVRLFEGLAGTSLLGGQQSALIGSGNADYLYDWCRNAAHFATPNVPWNAAGADIIGDIERACHTVRVNGKVFPNVMFLASDVANVFFSNEVIQRLADIRGYTFIRAGENNPTPAMFKDLENGGAVYRGYIQTPAGYSLHVFCYLDVFTDENGDPQKYLPDGMVFFAYYGARCDRYFGPPERLPTTSLDDIWYQEMLGMNMNAPQMPANIKGGGVIDPNMFYCDAYQAGDKKKVSIRTQSAPIYATTQTDAFYTMTNVLEVSS